MHLKLEKTCTFGYVLIMYNIYSEVSFGSFDMFFFRNFDFQGSKVIRINAEVCGLGFFSAQTSDSALQKSFPGNCLL